MIHYDYEVDYVPCILKDGTRMYRTCFENKQANCKFCKTYPGYEYDPLDPVIDVRAAVGDYNFKFPTKDHFERFQQMTYEEARAACLNYKLNRDKLVPHPLKDAEDSND